MSELTKPNDGYEIEILPKDGRPLFMRTFINHGPRSIGPEEYFLLNGSSAPIPVSGDFFDDKPTGRIFIMKADWCWHEYQPAASRSLSH